MPKSDLSQLHAVLTQEKAALMAADFAPLERLIHQKEQLLGRLTTTPPTAEALRDLRDRMDENQALLAAAIKGVAAAGERLAALRDVQSGLRIYDPNGRVELASAQGRSLEKKA